MPSTQSSRSFSSENARLPEIVKSDLLFTLPVARAMRHFRISHVGLKEAQAQARAHRPASTIERLEAQLTSRKAFQWLVRTERKYPRIHRLMHRGDTDPEVAEKFHITRARVYQLRDRFNALVASLKDTPEAVVRRLEEDARDVDEG